MLGKFKDPSIRSLIFFYTVSGASDKRSVFIQLHRCTGTQYRCTLAYVIAWFLFFCYVPPTCILSPFPDLLIPPLSLPLAVFLSLPLCQFLFLYLCLSLSSLLPLMVFLSLSPLSHSHITTLCLSLFTFSFCLCSLSIPLSTYIYIHTYTYTHIYNILYVISHENKRTHPVFRGVYLTHPVHL